MGRAGYVLLDDESELMFVPNEILECSAFIGVAVDGNFRWLGSAFYVFHNEDNYNFGYWVTAKHILRDAINCDGNDEFIYLRLNKRGGGVIVLATKDSQWTRHPTDEVADVAVLRFGSHHEVALKALKPESIITKEILASESVGPGDQVFMVGLFASHVSAERNSPILRMGNIAAMPEHPIATPYGEALAYLIEMRSIGGHSGSPVFVYLPANRVKDDGSPQLGMYASYFLLGLIHGHFKIPQSQVDMFAEFGSDVVQRKVYSGIAVVTPVDKILETIRHPLLAMERVNFLAAFRGASITTMDSGDLG